MKLSGLNAVKVALLVSVGLIGVYELGVSLLTDYFFVGFVGFDVYVLATMLEDPGLWVGLFLVAFSVWTLTKFLGHYRADVRNDQLATTEGPA